MFGFVAGAACERGEPEHRRVAAVTARGAVNEAL